jgi:hypothetical protein
MSRISHGKKSASMRPQSELYDLLWWYYENNGLYDALQLAGYQSGNECLKSLRNPAWRTVEFYTSVVWPGALPYAIPLSIDSGNEALRRAIQSIWSWSNWGQQKQVTVRYAAITGDVYLKIAQPDDNSRIYIQVIDPALVTEKRADERDFLTFVRIETQIRERGMMLTHVEIWDKERGSVRIWTHTQGKNVPIERLGRPASETPLSTWGIDFIPIVHIKHTHVGEPYGLGSFTLAIDKIDESNRQATRLHKMLFRHNDVTYVIRSNTIEPATGRPMPAPRIGPSARGGGDGTIEVGGERFISLPGVAELQQLVPALNYADALAVLDAQMREISQDLPETQFYSLKDLPEISGRAIRLIMTPALLRATEVRGNHETGLIRAHQMALTIGRNTGVFPPSIGTYEAGDFDHHIMDRPLLPLSRDEVADLAGAEVSAGVPLVTSLRRSGWTAAEVDAMLADKSAEQAAQQISLASALLTAQENALNGQASNGVEGAV